MQPHRLPTRQAPELPQRLLINPLPCPQTSQQSLRAQLAQPAVCFALQDAAPPGGFRYLDVEPSPPPSPRPPRGRGNGERQGSGAGALLPGSTPSTPRAGQRGSGGSLGADPDAASSTTGSSSSWPELRGRSGREQRQEEQERLGRSGRRQQQQDAGQLDLAPEAAFSRRQRWMREPPFSASPITPPDSGSEGEGGAGGEGSGTPRSRAGGGTPRAGGGGRGRRGGGDHHMAYLLRRQLKVRAAGCGWPVACADRARASFTACPMAGACCSTCCCQSPCCLCVPRGRRRSAAIRASASWSSLGSSHPGIAGRWAGAACVGRAGWAHMQLL